MNCKDIVQKIDAFLDQELLGEERKAFEEHLSQCETCRILLQKTQKLLRGVKTFSRVHAPAGFAQAVQKRLKGEEKVKNIFLSRRLILPIQLAALLIVGFFVFHEMLPRHPIPKGPVIVKELIGTASSPDELEAPILSRKRELPTSSIVENVPNDAKKPLPIGEGRQFENRGQLSREIRGSEDKAKAPEGASNTYLTEEKDLKESQPLSLMKPGSVSEVRSAESSTIQKEDSYREASVKEAKRESLPTEDMAVAPRSESSSVIEEETSVGAGLAARQAIPVRSNALGASPEKAKTVSFDSINDSQKEIQKWIWIVSDEDLAIDGLTQFLEEKGGSLVKQENDLQIIVGNDDEEKTLIYWLQSQGSFQHFNHKQLLNVDSKTIFTVHIEVERESPKESNSGL